MEPLEWTEDGWFRIPEGVRADQSIQKPYGQAVTRSLNFHDFQSKNGGLGFAWSWYKPRSPIEYDVDHNTISIIPNTYTVPIVFMPRDHAYEAQVEIEISGKASGRFVLFYNESTYSGLELSDEGLHGIIRGWRTPAKPSPSRLLFVRLRYIDHEVIFYHSIDGTEWSKFEHSFETSGWHHNALGGFLALRLALWAQGSGKVTFKQFEYRSL